jgi:hypothetical protein
MDSIASPKMKTTKREGIETHSLVCNIFGGRGRVGAPAWGLGKIDNQVNYSHGLAQTNQQVGECVVGTPFVHE